MIDDTRIAQTRACIDEARTLMADLQGEGGHNPVDDRRLGTTRSYLNSALSSLDWFDKRYPDERPAS